MRVFIVKGVIGKSILMFLLVCVIVASMILGIYLKQKSELQLNEGEEQAENENQGDDFMDIPQNPIATITLETGEIIKLELYPQIAPQTVCNFISLANSGFYDGLIFHRIIQGFVLQGGDPNGTGMGGPGYSIEGEFSSNGYNNDISHTEGVISMARAASYNSGGSQFFLVVGDARFLDGDYAAFGKTIDEESTDICMQLSVVPTGAQDRPIDPPKIATITVETFGYDYPEPTKLN